VQLPPSILVAEDSAVIQTVLREMLTRWGYEVVVAGDGAAAWEVLRGPRAPRLAIIDWMMPLIKGPELCRRLRAETHEPDPYVLLLTSRAEAADIVEGFDAGADDYLTKPFHAQELWARVRAGVRIVGSRQELAEARAALRRMNPRKEASILDELEVRDGEALSVLLVEIDRFRQIRDSFGRLAGDLVLRECGERIRGASPEQAISGRYSGDAFLVVLPGIDRAEAVHAGDLIRAAVGSGSFRTGAASFPVTCSVGVTDSLGPCAARLEAAEEALLAAKSDAQERIADALRASTASMEGAT
jgi:two-component system cell cycle response regulator